ncbi:MAG: alpha-mannosidase [Lentisphaeria bacterium]|nr:alpha-mannosidase [Lentisphaeria bacterium]
MREKIFKEQKKTFEKFLERLDNNFLFDKHELEAVCYHTVEPVPFEKRCSGVEMHVKQGDFYAKRWENAWFHFTCDVKPEWVGKPVWVRLNLGAEVLIFDNSGVPVFGLTTHSIYNPYYKKEYYQVLPCAESGSKIDFWCEAAANGMFGEDETDPDGLCRNMQIGVFDEEMFQLFADVNVLFSLFESYEKPCARKKQIASALARAEAVFADDPANASAARAILKKQLEFKATDSELTATTIGHAHIDVGWLWAVRESIRKAARTFSSQIANIEKYPEFIFGASQPQLYAFVKEHYPELFEKIRAQVKAGRWECQGGMWVEADCNITSGESMIRQFIHGKNFFMDEFGVDVKNLWIPDVFGYSAAMPQIIKKCGCDYFLTQKISWNQFNKFPYNTFMWQGIDGTKVLTHFPPEDTYNSSADPKGLIKARDNFNEADIIPEFMTLAGIGDGGGGPAMRYIENTRRCADLEGVPKVKFGTAAAFFERIKEYIPRLPAWVGELYLELHRGTLTTQSRTKRGNRKCEQLLAATEFIYSSLPTEKYPAAVLDKMWKTLLCNQFHDIIPGSSVRQVYTVTEKEYADIIEKCSKLIREAGEMFNACPDSLTLVNTLSYPVQELIKLPDSWSGCSVTDENGTPLPVQQDEDALWCLVDVAPCSKLVISKGSKANAAAQLNDGKLVLENELIRYEFDRNAVLLSAYDKERGMEIISGSGNNLNVYVDNPKCWDAWDIDVNYMDGVPAGAVGVSAVKKSSGALRQSLEFELACGKNSTVNQQVVLSSGSKRLDFVTRVDWHERHKMLRVAFKTAVNSTEASCDIQYGYTRRPTHTNTNWDFARFEVAAHNYVDISDANGGAALLNDCKYGYHLTCDTLDLNLLRSPTHPDYDADQGEHLFTYSFLPHSGNLTSGNVMREGAMLNRPLTVIEGKAGLDIPFALSEIKNVSVGAVKKAEKSDDLIIRLVETNGTNGSVKLDFARPVTITECNMIEWSDTQDIVKDSLSAELKFKPFEIRTLRIKR